VVLLTIVLFVSIAGCADDEESDDDGSSGNTIPSGYQGDQPALEGVFIQEICDSNRGRASASTNPLGTVIVRNYLGSAIPPGGLNLYVEVETGGQTIQLDPQNNNETIADKGEYVFEFSAFVEVEGYTYHVKIESGNDHYMADYSGPDLQSSDIIL